LSGTITGLVFAMGTDLHWNGTPVEISLPVFLQARLDRETIPLILPGFVFFKFFPFFGKLRAMMRFGLFTLIPIDCGPDLVLLAADRIKSNQAEDSVSTGPFKPVCLTYLNSFRNRFSNSTKLNHVRLMNGLPRSRGKVP
jgi:hypothetical protein